MLNELLETDRFASRIDQEHKLYEKALFFQNEGKKLFGILHLPLSGSNIRGKTGIVMCQPHFVEPLITQRLEVDIARSLAQKGFPVFRFHYRGCGDSEGNFKDTTLSTQLSDTLRAIDVFAGWKGLDSIALFGLRFGGAVALMAAETEKRVKFLILCEPVIEPREYYLEMLLASKSSILLNQKETISLEQMVKKLMNRGSIDVLGYPLYKKIFVESKSINLSQSIKKFSGKTLLIQISAFSTKIRRTFLTIGEQIGKNGGNCDIKVILERKLAWDFIMHPPFRSERIVQTILQWCEEKLDCHVNKALDKVGDSNKLPGTYSKENPKITMKERPLFVKSQNYYLFGMLHVPDQSLLDERTVVILLSGTSLPRTSRNRMGVRLARKLTDLGFYTFRFDYRGLGESTGVAESGNLDQLHTQDLVNILDFLTNHIHPKIIILVGICFGARTALSVLRFRKFHGLVLISAPTVNENGRMIHTASKKSFRLYYEKLKEWKKWGTFLDVGKIKRNLTLIIQKPKNKWKSIDVGSLIDNDFSNQFNTFVNDRIPSLIIYGTQDEYYENMNRFLQGIDPVKRKHIIFDVVKGEDVHSFVPARVQEVVIGKILDWVNSRYLENNSK